MRDSLQKVKGSLLLIGIWLLMISEGYASPLSGYYLEVDFLYWKPMHCPIFVAQRFNNITNVEDPTDELYLTGEYDPGVRARLGYQRCHWFGDISYLYFCPTENRKEGRDNFTHMTITGTFNPPNGTLPKNIGIG